VQYFPDRSTMGAPGICFVCERTPDEGTGYVDTLTSFTPGFPSHLGGAKYICEGCVRAAAGVCGFYADETVKAAAQKSAEVEGRFAAVLDYVEERVSGLTAESLRAVSDRAPIVVAAESAAVEAEAAKPKASRKPKATEAAEAPPEA